MAHIETKDPFGFVGSHVVRRQPKKGGEEHGWLTRYDETLDCYTLFVPGGGEPRLLARGEVMKFLSAPNIELHDDDQDDFPPPVKDTSTSRYIGVKLRRPRQSSSDDDSYVDEDVRGQVTCFLPFGDRYCVEYEDSSTEEVSESAVIDGMVALIKSPFFSSPSRKKTRNGSIRTRQRSDFSDDESEIAPVRRKRQRVETETDAGAEQIPSEAVTTVESSADEQKEDDVVLADQTEPEVGVSEETEPAPNILEIMNSAIGTTTRENALEMASHPVEEPMQVDEGEVADQDHEVEVVESREEPSTAEPAADSAVSAAPQTEKKNEVPFYIIDKKPHEATEPLPKRAMAFELLRASLLNLLDRREATVVKMAMHA
ncbi:Sulfate Permease (SulP) Family [Phytophthora cinnamomi]|uniref:Sulfate Permease (SulP) Family n=1 Tax=Phytophthora cinnamomi TaxID=4785 RepID=UPI0035597CFF|nr:Sulfate Permease (SulP) Family [Phytophthora cinnamomi]